MKKHWVISIFNLTAGDGKKKERLDDFSRIIKNLNLPKQASTGSPNGNSSGMLISYRCPRIDFSDLRLLEWFLEELITCIMIIVINCVFLFWILCE